MACHQHWLVMTTAPVPLDPIAAMAAGAAPEVMPSAEAEVGHQQPPAPSTNREVSAQMTPIIYNLSQEE